MKKRIWILALTFGALVIACETSTYSDIEQDINSNTDNTDNTDNNTPTDPIANTSVTYTNNIKSIMTTNCTSCHNGITQTPSLTTYIQVKNAANNGKLLCTIQANECQTMPPSGKMSQANIDLILLWKSQGYLE